VLAQVLGVRETGTQPLLGSVTTHLAGRQALLVLDNLEQVLAAGIDVAELLGACPRITVLVTSRAALRRDQVIGVRTGLRHFREGGPRLAAETVEGKRLLHNFGHVGSGWTIAPGCADMLPWLLEGAVWPG
jgi:hypothetical protein